MGPVTYYLRPCYNHQARSPGSIGSRATTPSGSTPSGNTPSGNTLDVALERGPSCVIGTRGVRIVMTSERPLGPGEITCHVILTERVARPLLLGMNLLGAFRVTHHFIITTPPFGAPCVILVACHVIPLTCHRDLKCSPLNLGSQRSRGWPRSSRSPH